MGDFNTENSEELDILMQAGLTPVHNNNTFPSWKPKKSIDHIFVSKEFEVVNKYVCPLQISDHLGIVAELKLMNNPEKKIIVKKNNSKKRKNYSKKK
jgi:endonuclease/exonuclease/phosphatase family metal-dependent hydrolase